jgi:hypothetical protein
LIVQEPPITKVVNILKSTSPEILSGIAWHFFVQSPDWFKEVYCSRIWDESEDIDFVVGIIRSFCANRLRDCNFDNIFEIFQRVFAGQVEIHAQDLARREKLQSRKLIRETVENPPGAEVQHQESLESQFGRIVYPKSAAKQIAQNEEARPQLDRMEGANVHNLGFHPAKSDRDSSGAKTEALGSQEGDRVLAVARDCETDRGRVLPDQSIKLVNQAQEPIAPVPETSPGVEVSFSDRQSYWADRGFFLIPEAPAMPEKNPAVEFEDCIYCTSPEYESWRDETYRCYRCEPEPDRNPILTGIPLSDRFLARYSPPQSETLHYELTDGYRVDTDGQLSLFEVQVVTEPEPPDPDDFESLDAFREAIALWEAQNPEPLNVSLDSMCEWAPCPHEWYEPKAENLPLKASSMIELPEQSQVMEFLRGGESCSDTSEFFIPTFGSLGDRSDRSDEPPDTGIFARLPKPKSPKFPPQSASQLQVNRKSTQVNPSQPKSAQVNRKSTASHRKSPGIPKLSRNYPETISLRRRWHPAGPIASVGDAMSRHYLREGLDNFSSQNQTPRSSFSRRGDRFLYQLPAKKMTTYLEIDIPVYRTDRYDQLERNGR